MTKRERVLLVLIIVVEIVVCAVIVATTGTASASRVPPPDDVHWLQLADCESGGRAHIDGGALQWLPATWRAAGGTEIAATAVEATLAEEIHVAHSWAHRVDPFGQWPTCWPRALARPHTDIPAWAVDTTRAPPAVPSPGDGPIRFTG